MPKPSSGRRMCSWLVVFALSETRRERRSAKWTRAATPWAGSSVSQTLTKHLACRHMWLSIHCIHESIALFNCPVRDAAVTCFDLSFAHEHDGASVPHRSCGCGCHCTPQIAHHREITVAWQWFLSPPETTRHDKTTDKSRGLKRLKPNETETERCRKEFPNLSTVSDPVHGFSRVTVSGHELQSYAHEDLSQGIGKLNQEKELWRSLLQRLKPSQTISNPKIP